MAEPFYGDVHNIPVHTSIKWFVHRCSDVRVIAVAVLAATAVQTAAWLPFDACFSHDPFVQTLIPLAEMCLTSFNMLLCNGLVMGALI